MNSYDLRYPIGEFVRQEVYSKSDIERHIRDIEQLPASMREAVRGLSEQQLNAPYREGGWSLRQVVHHVADSHLNAYTRTKLALTEENPTIRPYYEDRWAKLEDSTKMPIEVSLALIENLHKRWLVVLKAIRPDEWSKTYIHPEHNREFTLAELSALYAWHGKHHLAHITSLKAKMGW